MSLCVPCLAPHVGTSNYVGVNVVAPSGQPRVHCDGLEHSIEVFASGFLIGNNTVYVPGGLAHTKCNNVEFNASAWMVCITNPHTCAYSI